MKKILLLMVVLIATSVTTTAQDWMKDNNRVQAVYDFFGKFIYVDKEKPAYCVMNYPITYMDVYAITGKWTNPHGVSINAVVNVPDGERKKLATQAQQFYNNLNVHVATSSELSRALKLRYNIQSEGGPYNYSTKGFYLATPKRSYVKILLLRKKLKPIIQSNDNGIFDIDNSQNTSTSTNAFTPGTIHVEPAKKK